MVWRIKPSYLLLAGIHTGMYLGPSLVAQQSRIHLQCRRYMFNPWVFSSTTIQKHQFFGTQPSLQLSHLYMTTGFRNIQSTKTQSRRNTWASRWLRGKESACQCRRHRFNPWSGNISHATEQ